MLRHVYRGGSISISTTDLLCAMGKILNPQVKSSFHIFMIVVIFIVILFIFINNDEQDEAIGHPQIVIISTSSCHIIIIVIMIKNKDLLPLVCKMKPDTFTRLQLGVGREGHCEVTSLPFCHI